MRQAELCSAAILTFSGPAFASEGKYGGHLIAAFSADPGGFDPAMVRVMSHVVIEQVYGTLLNLDHDAVPYAGLAESWEQSEDGLGLNYVLILNSTARR